MLTPEKPTLFTYDYWQDACAYLSNNDYIMADLIKKVGTKPLLTSQHQPLLTLCRAIIGQQISMQAADAIWARFTTLINHDFCATKLLSFDQKTLRDAGLTKQKSDYILNIARFFNDKPHRSSMDYWQNQPFEQTHKELLSIKGIGPWSVQMFMIFCLNHPDIVPLGDLGVVKFIEQHYGIDRKDLAGMHKIAEKWSPYRTIAVAYLWYSFDNDIVQY